MHLFIVYAKTIDLSLLIARVEFYVKKFHYHLHVPVYAKTIDLIFIQQFM